MADNKKEGVPLSGAGVFDQELYAGSDAVYDTAIGVDGAEEEEDMPERGVARWVLLLFT